MEFIYLVFTRMPGKNYSGLCCYVYDYFLFVCLFGWLEFELLRVKPY